jgi:Domain of unknown function (DUF222)
LTGEPLDPLLSHTAAAQQRGRIGAEHVKTIRKFFKNLPDFVDFATRDAAEAQLAELPVGCRLRSCARPLTGWRPPSIKTATSRRRIGPGGVFDRG